MDDNSSPSVELLNQITDAFNRHDLDSIMQFFSEDCTMDLPRGSSPWGTRFVGKVAVREGIASRFAGIPDVHYDGAVHWVCGNRGVSEWLLTGTSVAGKRIAVRGCDHWEFKNGMIVRKDSYWKIVE